MQNNIIKIISILFLLLTSLSITQQSVARPIPQIPPKFVYRVELLGPDIIFKHSFRIWGKNNNYFSHLIGSSTREDTAFTSTTLTEESANYIAEVRFKYSSDYYNNPNIARLWIYKIRTNNKFYSTEGTMLYEIHIITAIMKEANLTSEERQALSIRRIHRKEVWEAYKHEEEWFTFTNNIKPSQIMYAYPVIRKGDKAVPEPNEGVINPNYKDTNELPKAPYAYKDPIYNNIIKSNASLKMRTLLNKYQDEKFIYVYKDMNLRWTFPPSFCETEDKKSKLSCDNLIPKPIRTLAGKIALPWNSVLLNHSKNNHGDLIQKKKRKQS